jgi:hypothetical protein
MTALPPPAIAVDERPSPRTGLIVAMIGMFAALAGCQSKPDCVVTPNNLVECNEAREMPMLLRMSSGEWLS